MVTIINLKKILDNVIVLYLTSVSSYMNGRSYCTKTLQFTFKLKFLNRKSLAISSAQLTNKDEGLNEMKKKLSDVKNEDVTRESNG